VGENVNGLICSLLYGYLRVYVIYDFLIGWLLTSSNAAVHRVLYEKGVRSVGMEVKYKSVFWVLQVGTRLFFGEENFTAGFPFHGGTLIFSNRKCSRL
jgi:hypothetical protein